MVFVRQRLDLTFVLFANLADYSWDLIPMITFPDSSSSDYICASLNQLLPLFYIIEDLVVLVTVYCIKLLYLFSHF